MPTVERKKTQAGAAALLQIQEKTEKLFATPPAKLQQEAEAICLCLSNLAADEASLLAGAALPYVRGSHERHETMANVLPAEAAKLLRALKKVEIVDALQQDLEQNESSTSDSRFNTAAALRQQRGEALRRMLLAMVNDGRTVIIKLAEHLSALRAVKQASPAEQRALAERTRLIFAPMANRLGIWQLKWELEDLAFRYLDPKNYQQIADWLTERRVDREKYIENFMAELSAALMARGIEADIAGRPKHIYSIWRKMQKKQLRFEDVYDIRAVRVIVADHSACYSALGVVHALWTPIPGEFDDYIANPKENLYRSLHTAVNGKHERVVEVQIRTQEMHDHAELGVAAHWRYKEGGRYDPDFEKRIAWLRGLLEPTESDNNDLLDDIAEEVFSARVYVLTPRGDVIDLPQGATPLDFAYSIHSDVGHRCRGAKVNGQIVPLSYTLKNGEQVSIFTSKESGPSRDWLNRDSGYLATASARSKVRSWFRSLNREDNITTGRQLLERELSRLNAGNLAFEHITEWFELKQTDELLARIGRGDITPGQLAAAIQRHQNPVEDDANAPLRLLENSRATQLDRSDIKVLGIGDLLTHIANCCHPVPDESIKGYVTRGRGVTVHRSDCPHLLNLAKREPARVIATSWGNGRDVYPVEIEVEAYDREGLLRDITSVLANDAVNLLGMNSLSNKAKHTAKVNITLEVSGLEELSRILNRISQVPNVQKVKRKA